MAQETTTANDSAKTSPIIEVEAFPSQRQRALDAEELKNGNAVAYVVFPTGHVERQVMKKGTTAKGRTDYDFMANPYNMRERQVTDGKSMYGGRLQFWRAF